MSKKNTSKKEPKEKNKSELSEKKILFLSLFIFVFTFIVYVITLFPSLSPVGDGAEMAVNAYLCGINHPPGYPLYTMISHFFTYIPAGDIAFRINLMSAFFASLASVLIFLSLYILLKSEISALSSALIYSFSYTFWKLSTCSEVFTFNVFIAAILIFILLYWRDRLLKGMKKNRLLYLFSFVFGLSLCHHHTVILMFPAFFFLVLLTERKFFCDRRLLISLAFFLAGLLPYIYIPLRAGVLTMNWGATGLDGFLGVVTRRGYGSMSLAATGEECGAGVNFIHNMTVYFASLYRQFFLLLILFVFPGLYNLFKKNKVILSFLLLLFIFTGPFFIFLANPPPEEGWNWILERFYLLSFIPVIFFVAYGMDFLFSRKNYPLLIYLSVIFVFFPLFYNYGRVNNSNNYVYPDYIRNLLTSLPENSSLVCCTDFTGMGVMYFQEAENFRKDVKVFQYGLLGSEWYIKEMRKKYPDLFPPDVLKNKDEIMKSLIEKERGNLYLDIPKEDFFDNLTPLGLVYRFEKDFTAEDIEESCEFLEDYKLRSETDKDLYNEYFTKEIIKTYGVAYYTTGKAFSDLGIYDRAEELYLKSLKIYEIPQVYNNLAFIYRQENKLSEAEELYLKSIDLNGDNFEAYFNLAIIYLSKGDFSRGEDYFEKSIEVEPKNPLPYSNLAILYEKQGEIKKAVKSLEDAIKLNPEMGDLYFNLGIILIKQGKWQEAEKEFKKALNKGYSEPEVEKMLDYIKSNS